MAKLLIKSQQTGSGPGAYLRGHVVGVYPDSHVFGAREGLPRFFVAEVSDTVLDDHPGLLQDEAVGGETVRRREWMVDVDSLPPGILTALEQNGLAAIPSGVLNAAVKIDERVPNAMAGGRRG